MILSRVGIFIYDYILVAVSLFLVLALKSKYIKLNYYSLSEIFSRKLGLR